MYGGKGGPLQKGVILGNLGARPPPMEICQRRACLVVKMTIPESEVGRKFEDGGEATGRGETGCIHQRSGHDSD